MTPQAFLWLVSDTQAQQALRYLGLDTHGRTWEGVSPSSLPHFHRSQFRCGKGAYVTQWSYEPGCAEQPKTDGSWWRVLTKRGPLEEEMQITPVFLPREPHEQYENAKRYDTRRWAPGRKVSNMLLGKSRGQLLIAPERMKWLITLQYCSGFCHTLTWISHGFTCIPHPDPPSHLPLYPITRHPLFLDQPHTFIYIITLKNAFWWKKKRMKRLGQSGNDAQSWMRLVVKVKPEALRTIRHTWIWANVGRQWRTEEPGVLQSMGLQSVRHNLATEQQQLYPPVFLSRWLLIFLFGVSSDPFSTTVLPGLL